MKEECNRSFHPSAFIRHPSVGGPNAVGTTSLKCAGQSMAGVSTLSCRPCYFNYGECWCGVHGKRKRQGSNPCSPE